MISFEEFKALANEHMNREYEVQKPKNITGEVIRLLFANLAIWCVICKWSVNTSGTGFLFLLSIIAAICFALWSGLKVLSMVYREGKNIKAKRGLERYEYGRLQPYLIRLIHPETKKQEDILKSELVRCGHGEQREGYVDYGMYQYKLSNGKNVSFAVIDPYSISKEKLATRDRNGMIFKFENVLSEVVPCIISVHHNEEQYDTEVYKSLGINYGVKHRDIQYFAKGSTGLKFFLNNGGEFAKYYKPMDTDRNFGNAFLTPGLRDKLVRLHKEYEDKWFGVYYTGRDVYVFVRKSMSVMVGGYEKPIIRDDLLYGFYRLITESDIILDYVLPEDN